MKLLNLFILLLICTVSFGQYNTSSKSYDNIASLKQERGVNGIRVSVAGHYYRGDGGDRFMIWNDTSTKTPVTGIIEDVGGIPVGRWELSFSGSEYNYLWFGAKPDGITYNTSFQKAIDYISTYAFGSTLSIPKGTYIDTSHALLKTGCNIKGAGRFITKIVNNIASYTGAKFAYQNPLRLGNMSPSDWDSTVMNTYRYDSIIAGGSKIVMHNMPDSVQAGKVMMIRSSPYWLNRRGLIKPYITRLMLVTARVNDTAYFEHPVDTIVANGNFSMELDFKNDVNKTDNYGQLKRFIKNASVEDISLISQNGQVCLGAMLYQCTFNRIHTYGYESISGNGEAWCKMNDFYIEWWKQVGESSIGSHDNMWTNIQAYWVPRTDGIKTNSKQPFFKFGENAYNCHFKNIFVNAGDFNGRVFWFGAATKCSVEDFTIVAKNVRSNLVYFSTSDQDPDDSTDDFDVASIVANNVVRNGTIVGNRANKLQQFVYFYKPITLGQLFNNVVDNVNFYGTPTGPAIKMDGEQSVVRNCWFENSDVAYGDSIRNVYVENTWVPAAITPTGNNATFINVKTPGALLNTSLAGDYRPFVNYLDADTAITTATLTGSGLQVPVAANKYYTVTGSLKTSCTGTNGINFSFTAPSGTTFKNGNIVGSGAAQNLNATTAKIAAFGSTAGAPFNKFSGSGGVQFVMSFTTGANAGVLELQFSSDGSATSTIQSNSFMSIQENNLYTAALP